MDYIRKKLKMKTLIVEFGALHCGPVGKTGVLEAQNLLVNYNIGRTKLYLPQ